MLMLIIISDVIFLIMFTISFILGYKIKEMCKGTEFYELYGFCASVIFSTKFSELDNILMIRILLIIGLFSFLLLPIPFFNILIPSVELYFNYMSYRETKKELCESVMEKLMS